LNANSKHFMNKMDLRMQRSPTHVDYPGCALCYVKCGVLFCLFWKKIQLYPFSAHILRKTDAGYASCRVARRRFLRQSPRATKRG